MRLADKTGGLVWSRANMREQTKYSDITLISQEGVQFPAHRLILSVTSSFVWSWGAKAVTLGEKKKHENMKQHWVKDNAFK